MSYKHLTETQRGIIDAIVDRRGQEYTLGDVADEVGCTPSYASYVRQEYQGVIVDRRGTMRIAADGEGHYDIQLGVTSTHKAIKLLPSELSREIFDQIRSQEP